MSVMGCVGMQVDSRRLGKKKAGMQMYKRYRGMTLLELIIAMVVFLMVILGAIGFLGWTLKHTAEADNRLLTSLAAEHSLSVQKEKLEELLEDETFIPVAKNQLKEYTEVEDGFPDTSAFPTMTKGESNFDIKVTLEGLGDNNDMYRITVEVSSDTQDSLPTIASLIARRS